MPAYNFDAKQEDPNPEQCGIQQASLSPLVYVATVENIPLMYTATTIVFLLLTSYMLEWLAESLSLLLRYMLDS